MSSLSKALSILLLCLLPVHFKLRKPKWLQSTGWRLGCSACKIFIEEFFNAVARAPSALFKGDVNEKSLARRK